MTFSNGLKCEGCFWLDRVRGVKFPSFPPFNINSLTDKLLKREFDEYRGKKPIPWITEQGWPNLIPYDHEDLENWTDSLHFGSSPCKFNTIHKETNILFGGGIDDMMINRDTEKNSPGRLQKYRAAGRKSKSHQFRRQMEAGL